MSVIIPSFQGRSRITGCLRSLADQSLDQDHFEIIVALNGPNDGTAALLDRFHYDHPDVDLKVLHVADAGASRARNAGIAAASRQHATFVDDDDSVSPGYLETLLNHAAPGLVPFAQIVNVDGAGRLDPANSINIQTIRYAGQTVHPELVPRAVGFNACKLIPTHMVKRIAYDTELRSGVDVAFFMTLLAQTDFSIFVCPVESGPDARNAVYYRLMRPHSMSRREISFEFNVIGRLEVMSRLQALAPLCDERRLRVLQMSMSGQASFINRYIAAHPEDLFRVLEAIDSYGLTTFPYYRLTSGLAKSLVVSCDVSVHAATAASMARRVSGRGEVVDIVHNASVSAGAEPATARLVHGLVDRDIPLNTPSSAGDWSDVEAFCAEGLHQLETGTRARVGYRRIYSCGTSPGSHILAASFKLRHPGVKWIAELSDQPMPRVGWLRRMASKPGPVFKDLSAGLATRGIPTPDTTEARGWGEYLAFTLADELMFADDNEMENMLGRCGDAVLVQRVRAKANLMTRRVSSPSSAAR